MVAIMEKAINQANKAKTAVNYCSLVNLRMSSNAKGQKSYRK